MKASPHVPIPALKALRKLGQDINDARRRRRITIKLLAERAAAPSRSKVLKIEKGDPTVSIGRYASMLFVLGMIDRLSDLQRDHSFNFARRRRYTRRNIMVSCALRKRKGVI